LKVGESFGGIGLAGERAHHAHGNGILQTFRTTDSENELAYMGPLQGEKRQCGQIGLVDFEKSKIGFRVLAHKARFNDAALADWDRRVSHRKRQGHANALSAFHHMGIGHDVTAGVDNNPRTHRVLANDERSLGSVFFAFAERPVAGDENLHDCGGNLGGKGFKGAVELD
jgi:hypothetical protein